MSDNRQIAFEAFARSRPGKGGWYRSNCPFCIAKMGTPDKRQSWGCFPDSGWWHCFRCDTHGWLTPRTTPTKVRTLNLGRDEISEVPLPKDFIMVEIPRRIENVDVFDMLDSLSGPLPFLSHRGIPAGLARSLRVGYCVRGRYHNRVIFPIAVAGRNLGFVARAWDSSSRIPYLYPEGMQRGQILFNQDAIQVRTSIPLMLVEGVLDAIPYWPDAVACLGKPSQGHIKALGAAKRPIVICLDGDAWRLGARVAERLAFDGAHASFVRLPPKRDPNDLAVNEGPTWLIDRVDKAALAAARG